MNKTLEVILNTVSVNFIPFLITLIPLIRNDLIPKALLHGKYRAIWATNSSVIKYLMTGSTVFFTPLTILINIMRMMEHIQTNTYILLMVVSLLLVVNVVMIIAYINISPSAFENGQNPKKWSVYKFIPITSILVSTAISIFVAL